MAGSLLEEINATLGVLPEGEREAIVADALAASAGLAWVPNPGPQTEAYFCEADELFYGGQAGGGKSDLLAGLALTAHRSSLLLRRLSDDVKDLAQRAREIAGPAHSYNGQDKVLRLGERVVRIGGCQYEEDKERHKGRPRDFYGFDEICDFTFGQYKFITAWNRSTRPGQRCRVVCAGNPPTRPEGLWVIKYWGAWLDPSHSRPARPGELRWYVRGPDDEDIEVEGRGPHSFDWARKPVLARSRTFIPSALADNPDLAKTDYEATLDNLPVELQRAYRDGDFTVGLQDGEFQVIPTAWIELAQKRWSPAHPAGMAMTAMGLDVAPGGTDSNVLAARYGGWYAPLIAWKAVDKDGSATAGKVVQHRRDRCPVVVDLGGGWGGDAVIRMKENGVDVFAFNGVLDSSARTRDGRLKFYNKRAEVYWRFREALDPNQEGGSAIALPPDAELKADLAAPTWKLTKQGILLEPKEDIRERIGRSPDKGDAAVMCLSEGNAAIRRNARNGAALPAQANVGYGSLKRRR